MNTKDILNKGLPKWPLLVVKGDKVTLDQAKEILIRTDNIFDLSSNDHIFEKKIYSYLLGIDIPLTRNWMPSYELFKDEEGKIDWKKANEASDKIYKEIRKINIDFLKNNRIVSAYVGGPHGWCDWDGNIGCNTYNIGKYPSCEDVYEEWKTIAKAFPFLKLTCQLFSGEQCEDDIVPVIEYQVSNGKVKVKEPIKSMLNGTENNMSEYLDKLFLSSTEERERGCTFEMFKEAHRYTVNLFK